MALRPVSELGLVEVTDVAAPAAAAPRRRRNPRPPESQSRQQASGTPTPDDDRDTTASRRAEVATSVVSAAIGVAGAVLVGRALLRR
jgi:hypothetical protein